MRSLWRTDSDLLRDVLALAAAVGLVGASFGALAVAGGMSVWLTAAMSALVFAGGSQFLVVAVLTGGGSAVAALAGGLLLNARHLPFGLAMGGVLGEGRAARLVGAHLLVDETVAFARAQQGDDRRARLAYWASGAALFVAWNTGSAVGALAGDRISDPAAFGVDAAFPAGLLALVLPSLRGGENRAARQVALAGAAIALLATPVLPVGLPVLAAAAAALLIGRGPRR